MHSARAVDSGEYDLRVQGGTRDEPGTGPPYELSELLAYLASTHTVDDVYRGQIRAWPAPLVPSMYRGAIDAAPVTVASTNRLRDAGNRFHAVVPDAPDTDTEICRRRIRFNSHLHQVFGYAFGSILAQQCGVTSEGLDVTHDPYVAALFAAFDFAANEFREAGEGVIYRFRTSVPGEAVNPDIAACSFYDCPPVISAFVIFHQLRSASSGDVSLESFQRYAAGLAKLVPQRRPLELLALPAAELPGCRVVQQRAALLLPDVVLPGIYSSLNRRPPAGKADWDGPLLVEDIAARDGVEAFAFRHRSSNRYVVPLSPPHIFPRRDGVTSLLRRFFAVNPELQFLTEFGLQGIADTSLIR